MISESTVDGLSVAALAARLDVSDRQLRRLFHEHLGAAPKSIAQAQRFAIARQLLIETHLPVADVAMAAGFQSLRRFNDAALTALGMTPSAFRLRHGRGQSQRVDTLARLRLTLAYRPPFAWGEIIGYFGRRAISGLELVDGNRYTRAVRIGNVCGTVTAEADLRRNRLIAEFALDRAVQLTAAVQRLRDLFDLDASPRAIADQLGNDPLLGSAVAQHPGLRIPGCWSVFEMLTRAIVGQQVSVAAATTILGRLVEQYGRPIASAAAEFGAPMRAFPEAAEIAERDLRSIGLTKARAQTLARVARLFADEPLYVDTAMDRDEARRRLLEIRGIGPWTAEYVALRALRDPDAFPASDLGVIKAAGLPTPRAVAERAEGWRPWRAYAVLYLWKSLEQCGVRS